MYKPRDDDTIAEEETARSMRCGVTLRGILERATLDLFQSARRQQKPLCRNYKPRPREGATSIRPPSTTPRSRFNPRPREGATATKDYNRLSAVVSIHAP